MHDGTCGYFSFILSSQAFLPGWRNRRRSSRHPVSTHWGLDVLLCYLYRFVDSCPDGGTDEGAPAIPSVHAGGWMYFYVIYTVLLIPARMAELVDALVSNTSGSNTVPVRSRLRVQKRKKEIFDLDLPFFRFVSH